MELTKQEKKIVREIIEKGLLREMDQTLRKLGAILTDYSRNDREIKETYYTIYNTVADFDKHIARRYDGLTGSQYLFVITGQYRDGVIAEEDLDELSPELREKIKSWNRL